MVLFIAIIYFGSAGGVAGGFFSTDAMGCGCGMGCGGRTVCCGAGGLTEGNGFTTAGDTEMSNGGSGRLCVREGPLVEGGRDGIRPPGGDGR